MDLVSLRRQHILWTIQQNPVTITIQRTEKKDMGGYFGEAKSTHGPYTVRVFRKGYAFPKEVSTLAGTKQTDGGWGLVTDWNADIKASSNILDEFDVPDLGHFIIVAVYPQIVQGEIVGYQADLEKVS